MKVASTLHTLATIAISGATAVNWDQTLTQNNTNGTGPIPKPLTWAPQVKYFSALARGFIQGYRRGMYKDNNYRVANNCFDKTTQNALTSVLDGASTLSFDWNSQLTNIIYSLKAITDNCEYDESLYDYLTYCYEGDMCEPQNMMGTLLKKVFQVTTIANDLAQVYAEGLPSDQAPSGGIEDFGERLGSNVGKLLRYATEFDPNVINAERLYQ
jgi:hypothetical protein